MDKKRKRLSDDSLLPFPTQDLQNMFEDLDEEGAKILGTLENMNDNDLDQIIQTAVKGINTSGIEPDAPFFQAQQLALKGFKSKSKKQKMSLAKKALDITPNCPDAYFLLSSVHGDDFQLCFSYLRLAVTAGENIFNDDFVEAQQGNLWHMTETKGYLRALEALAHCYTSMNRISEAVQTFDKLLCLNPNDNQGVRYPLQIIFLLYEDFNSFRNLTKAYKLDESPWWCFNQALYHWVRNGFESKSALKFFKKGQKGNPHVMDYVSKNLDASPSLLNDYYTKGSPQEALDYFIDARKLWEKYPDITRHAINLHRHLVGIV